MSKRFILSLFAVTIFFSLSSTSMAQALKPDLMYCGIHYSSGSSLYLGVGPFNEVTGCAPDADTQALLVTRTGNIAGSGAAWLAYLNAGGVIITEFSISDEVFNEIYGTSHSAGSYYGICDDNIMPSLKLNPGSEFWQVNSGFIETPAGAEGCGYDLTPIVDAEPAVNALGGIINTSFISLAVRQQGSGVLWLVESDWIDNEDTYSDASKNLMGVLISGGTYSFALAPIQDIPALSPVGLLLLALGFVYLSRRRIRV